MLHRYPRRTLRGWLLFAAAAVLGAGGGVGTTQPNATQPEVSHPRPRHPLAPQPHRHGLHHRQPQHHEPQPKGAGKVYRVLPWQCKLDAQKAEGGQQIFTSRRVGTFSGCPGTPWAPTPERPLRVHLALNFTVSGKGGLSNILWSDIYALREGCRIASGEVRLDPAQPDDPERASFAVVVLPPLKSELAELRPGARQRTHHYSDLFDLDLLARLYLESVRCVVTDDPGFARLVETGAVVPSEDLEVRAGFGRNPKAEAGVDMARLYKALEMSEGLRQRLFEPCWAKLKEAFHGSEHFMAVHMRVEDDWVGKYCMDFDGWSPPPPNTTAVANATAEEEGQQQGNDGVLRRRRRLQASIYIKGKGHARPCFGADEIANITLSTKGLRRYKNILLIYAADNFMKPGHERPDILKAHPKEVWPPGVLTTSPWDLQCFGPNTTYTERTAVSFFLAAKAEAFTGLSLSTFNLGMSKYRQMRGQVFNTYFYDCLTKNYRKAVPSFYWKKNC